MGWLFGFQFKDELVESIVNSEIPNTELIKHSVRGNDLYLLYKNRITGEFWLDSFKIMKQRHGYGYKSMTLYNAPKSFIDKIQGSSEAEPYLLLLDRHNAQKQYYKDLKACLDGAEYDVCITDHNNNPVYTGRVWYTDYGQRNKLVIRNNECGTLFQFRDTSLDGLYAPI